MATTKEKPAKVQRPTQEPVECQETMPRSPDSDKIIERLIERHRGALEGLAKHDCESPEEKLDENRRVARMLVERHADALRRLAKR